MGGFTLLPLRIFKVIKNHLFKVRCSCVYRGTLIDSLTLNYRELFPMQMFLTPALPPLGSLVFGVMLIECFCEAHGNGEQLQQWQGLWWKKLTVGLWMIFSHLA